MKPNPMKMESDVVEVKFSRVRDLPEDERGCFERYLSDQTRPLEEGVPMEEQDFYYPWDYESWLKQGKPEKPGFFYWD